MPTFCCGAIVCLCTVCMYFKNTIFEINEWFLCLLWDFTLKQYFMVDRTLPNLDSFFDCLCWKYFLTFFFVYILNCNSFSFLKMIYRPPRSWVFNTLFIQYYSVICRPPEPRTCDLEVCSLTAWPSHLLHQTVILPFFSCLFAYFGCVSIFACLYRLSFCLIFCLYFSLSFLLANLPIFVCLSLFLAVYFYTYIFTLKKGWQTVVYLSRATATVR